MTGSRATIAARAAAVVLTARNRKAAAPMAIPSQTNTRAFRGCITTRNG